MSGRIAWISLTPVKATALQLVDEVELLEGGPKGDRRFYLRHARPGAWSTTRIAGRCSSCRPSTTSTPTRSRCGSPDGAVVSGSVERGEEVETRFHSTAADRPARARAVGRGSVGARRASGCGSSSRAHGAADRGRGGAATLLATASLGALAQTLGVDRGRRPPLPHELRGRRARAARGGRLARPQGCGRRGGRRAHRECRPVRRHDPEPRDRAGPTSTR